MLDQRSSDAEAPYPPAAKATPLSLDYIRRALPGLAVVAVATAIAQAVNGFIPEISALVVAVVLGAILGNVGVVTPTLQPGFTLAARRLLRLGIVLLGLRLSLGQLGELGLPGLLVVVITVSLTFFGVQALGRMMGLSKDLSLLVATGYAICGASAIAAVEGATDAEEEEVAMAIGLVTLFGSLAIFVLPVVGDALGMTAAEFGTWAGASVHDVAQVVATAEPKGEDALTVAVIVKLTRVILLAPIVAGVNIAARRNQPAANQDGTDGAPPLIPLFVLLFLAMIGLRSSGILSANLIDLAKTIEGLLLTAALVGLGAGVRIKRLRRLGIAPLILGVVAWVLIAAISYVGVLVAT